MIKVTIKDSDALKSIKIDQLKTYLTANGWYKKDDVPRIMANGQRNNIAELWSQDIGPTARTAVVVPNSENDPDYTRRMVEAIMSLEKIEARSQLEIFVDVTKKPIVIRPSKKKIKKSKN